jgi:hypothetical protein
MDSDFYKDSAPMALWMKLRIFSRRSNPSGRRPSGFDMGIATALV